MRPKEVFQIYLNINTLQITGEVFVYFQGNQILLIVFAFLSVINLYIIL